jgi:hypothetical protein
MRLNDAIGARTWAMSSRKMIPLQAAHPCFFTYWYKITAERKQIDNENIYRTTLYKVIQKSLRDFRPLRYRSRDGHAEGEHINGGRDTPNFCPTLQMLDMSTLSDAADANPVIKFPQHVIYHSCDKGSWRQSLLSTATCCNVCGRNLITGLTSAASPRVDISNTCKVGQKHGVSLPLMTRSPSA